jgi:Protein of unknown function (DUF1638)
MSGHLKLNICDYSRAEILALQKEPEFADLVVDFFPAKCGQPPLSLSKLTQEPTESTDDTSSVCIGSACIAHLDRNSNQDFNVDIHYIRQCFSIYIPEILIEHFVMSRVYLCSPGWLADWRSHMKKYGDDKLINREMVHESVSKIVLLDTGVTPDIANHLNEFAEYLDLPCETLPVGLDHFRLKIHNLLLQHEARKSHKQKLHSENIHQHNTAQYAMALEILSDLAQFQTEDGVFDKIEYVLSMLFAPVEYHLLTVTDGKAEKLRSLNSKQKEEEIITRLMNLDQSYGINQDGLGLYFKIVENDNTLSIIELTTFAQSGSIQEYLNLCLAIRGIFALAIMNARTFSSNLETTRKLKEALENVKVLRGMIPICSFCKQIRSDKGAWQAIENYISSHSEAVFSHGICPDCYKKHYPEYADESE